MQLHNFITKISFKEAFFDSKISQIFNLLSFI